jgi:hypothetical protein
VSPLLSILFLVISRTVFNVGVKKLVILSFFFLLFYLFLWAYIFGGLKNAIGKIAW